MSAEAPKQESTAAVYRRNREPLWAFWIGGEKALKAFGLPEDSGAALLCRFAALGDPTAIAIIAKQACGNPPTDLTISGDSIVPGAIFGVLNADGSPLALPPIPGLARPAAGVVPVPASGPGGSTP